MARRDLMQSINKAIEKGELVNRDGAQLAEALPEALVTDDGKMLYPIDDGIPVLIEGEAIALEQLNKG